MTPSIFELSDGDRQILDSWVGDFDLRWEDGLLSRKAGQIPRDSAWRLPALAEMIKIDLERQWRRGHESSVESYLEQFPELSRADELSADLILAEFEVRRQVGAPADLEGYLRRFPAQAGEIARRIASGSSSPRAGPSSSGSSRRPAAPEPKSPARIGRYRIIKRLGHGGMGSVYLAEDTQLGRKVALKVPRFGPNEGPDARERFFREARTAATLDHPYLCPVFDVGEVDGHLYLTMAFIEGKSLAESLKGEGMPTRQVAALVGKLAVALHQAHAKGVVHRDLKPANVMIKVDGTRREPVIVDFGLALRDEGDDARMTKTGQVMGTLAYMSPEQVMGDLAAIGPSCDIFALGVILYELLTGRLPFNGSGLAIAGQILTQTPLPPTSIREGLDPRIEAICLKAMAKKPANRFASMGELAAALTEFLKAPAISATESTPPKSAPSPSSEGPKTSGGDRLMAEFFQGLATGDTAESPRLAPKSKKPTKRPVPLELPKIEADEEVEPVLIKRRTSTPARPPWVWPAVGAGVLAPCLVVFLLSRAFLDKTKDDPSAESESVKKTEIVDSHKPPEPLVIQTPANRTITPNPTTAPTSTTPPVGPASFENLAGRPTLLSGYRAISPMADGVISPGEYGPPVEVDFTAASRYGSLTPQMSDPSTSKAPEDLSVQLYTSYSDRSLFLAFRVRDQFIDADDSDATTPFLNDAVEIFLDGDRTSNDFVSTAEGAKISTSEGFQIISDTRDHHLTTATDFNNTDWKSRTSRELGGYIMEFEIPLNLIDVADGPPKRPAGPGSLLNCAFSIDDLDVPGNKMASHAFIRANSSVKSPFFNREDAWSLGIKLEPKSANPIASNTDAGWKSLFNGKDLDGWRASDSKGWMANFFPHWSVRDGILHGEGGMSYLFTPSGGYRNFRVRIEAKINKTGNSGLFFRVPNGPRASGGIEAQINSAAPDPSRTGSLVHFNPFETKAVEKNPVAPDTWFVMEVVAVGNSIKTFVDGKLTLEWPNVPGAVRPGYFAIQSHDPDTHVQVRKIEVQELDDSSRSAAETAPEAGFRPIFNGKDLDGWEAYDSQGKVKNLDEYWTVRDGVLHGDGGLTHLFAPRGDYRNFRVRAEARINEIGNSGLFFRAAKGPRHIDGYEAQIDFSAPDAARTGSLYSRKLPKPIAISPSPAPADTWFTLEVLAVGSEIKTFVDGKLQVSWTDPTRAYRQGYFAIQSHDPNSHVQIRKLEVQELNDAGLPIASTATEDDFRSIFNGKNLDGWRIEKGVPGIWSVEDGHLIAKGAGSKAQSWLFSEGEYKDFRLRFEAYLPAESDSGVAVWGDFGEVNPIEVNLRRFSNGSSPTGSVRLSTVGDPSAYLPPDKRAEILDEPLWNVFEIDSRGGKLRVKVNHEEVNAIDLTSYASRSGILPAVRRGRGRVGFQAHTGTVHFRAIEIKPL